MPAPPNRRQFLLASSLALATSAWSGGAEASGRAWLGVELVPGPAGGVVVRRVMRGSPAERDGLRDGDHVRRCDGVEVERPGQVVERIAQKAPGEQLALEVRRGDTSTVVKVTLVVHPGEEGVLRLDKVGTHAPAWKGVRVVRGGIAPSLAALRGKVVLLDFWASWCVACRVSVPMLNRARARFGAQGLEVVGLTDDREEVALRAADKLGIAYAVGAATSTETLADYGVRALPTLFVVDRGGVVRHASIGVPREADLEALLRSELGRGP
jgi:thiol-disulfide isomerase/thioredoxin